MGDTKSIVMERLMPHPPEKVWRALTQAPLIADWLMVNDFQPVVGHRFTFRAPAIPDKWDGIVESEVLQVEPPHRLAYGWDVGPAGGMRTVVTWTLTAADGGTQVRMEHSGFRPDQENNLRGAEFGWRRFMAGLEQVVARAA